MKKLEMTLLIQGNIFDQGHGNWHDYRIYLQIAKRERKKK